jgi:hypothetical protein
MQVQDDKQHAGLAFVVRACDIACMQHRNSSSSCDLSSENHARRTCLFPSQQAAIRQLLSSFSGYECLLVDANACCCIYGV